MGPFTHSMNPVGHRARDRSHAEGHRGGTAQSLLERKSWIHRLLQGDQPTSHTHRVLHCCGAASRRGRLLLELFVLPTVSPLSLLPNREISLTHTELQTSWNVCRQEYHGNWSVEPQSFQGKTDSSPRNRHRTCPPCQRNLLVHDVSLRPSHPPHLQSFVSPLGVERHTVTS